MKKKLQPTLSVQAVQAVQDMPALTVGPSAADIHSDATRSDGWLNGIGIETFDNFAPPSSQTPATFLSRSLSMTLWTEPNSAKSSAGAHLPEKILSNGR